MSNTLELFSKLKNIKTTTLDYLIFRIRQREQYREIKKNMKFKNLHKGERCFIVGNGPSLMEQDLSLLENEIVFTVNQIARHPDFDKIKSNYHFWADPIFFDLSEDKPEDMELLDTFKKTNSENNSPICFLPVMASNFVNHFKLHEELNIYFYNPKVIFCDDFDYDIDFTKFAPGFQTVVQYAIAMAIYMGFSHIYLLGCDTTGIISTINAFIDEDCNGTYAYKVSSNEQKRIKLQSKTYDMEKSFNGWARILHLYKELNKYCVKRNISLINCSGKTIIDTVTREKYSDVIVRKDS